MKLMGPLSPWLVIGFYLGWYQLNAVLGSCPDADAITPCSCNELVTKANATTVLEVQTFVTCKDMTEVSVLFQSARGMDSTVVHTFMIFNSHMGYLPSNMFLGSLVTSVQVYHTNVSHFTEANETAFMGLEDHLLELVLSDCKLDDSIQLETLSNLTELKTLDVSNNRIVNVPKKWFYYPPRKLQILSFKNNLIEKLEPGALAHIQSLKFLDLSENRLTTLDRSILPSPAGFLEYLYISYNDLESLPNDFFQEMPIMKKVYLDYNNLRLMTSSPYQELWIKKRDFSHIDILGNDLLCDTSLCWFTLMNPDALNSVTGSCSHPDKLRGRRLRTLWPWDLNCNESIYHGDMKLPYRAQV